MTTVPPERKIDGKGYAHGLQERLASQVDTLKSQHGITPGLAVVIVGEDPASQVYVGMKTKRSQEVGFESIHHELPASTSQQELLDLVGKLNADPKVNGILVQMPLPEHIDPNAVIDAISPEKDVDGFHIANVGKLNMGRSDALVPCTPQGCMLLAKDTLGDLTGKHAVVLGRSNIVGRPLLALLIQANCTVTVAHSKTRDVAGVCREADLLMAAVGKPGMVKADWVKDGATVIDVGINRIEDETAKKGYRLVGDVATAEVAEKAHAITPVPGGVGPMTIACLLRNTVIAAHRQNGLALPEGL